MPTVQTSPEAAAALQRFSSRTRKVYTSKTRLDWSQRKAPRKRVTLTAAEKAIKLAKSKVHKSPPATGEIAKLDDLSDDEQEEAVPKMRRLLSRLKNASP